MKPPRPGRRRLGAVLVVLVTAAALTVNHGAAYGEISPDQPPPTLTDATSHETDRAQLADFDVRTSARTMAPTSAQADQVARLGATARWSPFGTPQSLIRHGGALAEDLPAADATAAARAWLDQHRDLYQLDSADLLDAHREIALTDDAYVVIFQQRIGGHPVSPGGFASVGVTGSADEGWSISYVSSTMVPHAPLSGSVSLNISQALAQSAGDSGVEVPATEVTMTQRRAGWWILDTPGVASALGLEQLARVVAFPAADGEIRAAWETIFMSSPEEGYRHIVDATTGEVLLRESIVHDSDEATWDVYPAQPLASGRTTPPWNYPSADTRERWCWTSLPGCDRVLENDTAGVPWDIDAQAELPTFTSIGNAVDAFEAWFGGAVGQRPVSDDRRYEYPWTNAWHESGCHPDNLVPGGNDIDASVTTLFAANWQMHNWSYRLGFTEETFNAQAYNFGRGGEEGDPVLARAQAGAVTGSRNNATMATRPDGISSIMSMFLWQPRANDFYGPCAVGDYDITVVGHEYAHMIENRLIGKGGTRSGFHAGALGESWSDFLAVEQLLQYGQAGVSGANPFTVGAYVTGNPHRGIRNYNMSFPSAGQFPQPGRDVRVGTLHFGAMGYDIVGPQVHADSQIWSATNHDLRTLFLERYPSQGQDHQIECAEGLRPLAECPGNRHWIQLVFDAMLLMPTAPTMLDARDAYFAADQLRFGGANQDLLWLGFARRGFGEHASVSGTQDTDPVPSFSSPLHEPATLRFEAVAKDEGGQPINAEVHVGNYEARTTPIGQVEQFAPNPDGYNFVARADGYGHVRFFIGDLTPGEDRTVTIHMPTNVASVHQGATASGDGTGHAGLIDDTEGTNWHSGPGLPHQVVVDPPSAAAGTYGAAGADFGPAPTPDGFAGDIVLVDDGSDNPTEGCDPLIGFPAGAIALVDRGTCPFTQKVANAQAAGAGAVIVANNVPGDPINMSGADPSITIASVMVSLTDGGALAAGLPATGRVATVVAAPVRGTQVTVALDGSQRIRHAQASAMLLPGQNRFTALRQFELYACSAGSAANPTCDAAVDAGWKRIMRSHRNAFPAPNPRPAAPDLNLRGFNLPTTDATHVKLVVLTNQCTGNPGYQGEQHSDPQSPTSDCTSTSTGANEVRAAELQLLTSKPQVDGATRVG